MTTPKGLNACIWITYRRGYSHRVTPPVLQVVDDQDLDHARDRDRAERPDHARDLRADEHGDENDERREPHRAPVDHGLQEVVLDLLVDDEPDDQHDPGQRPVEEADGADDDRGEGRAGERYQVED